MYLYVLVKGPTLLLTSLSAVISELASGTLLELSIQLLLINQTRVTNLRMTGLADHVGKGFASEDFIAKFHLRREKFGLFKSGF